MIEELQDLMNDDEKAEDKKNFVDILLYLRKEGLELDLSKDNLKSILMVCPSHYLLLIYIHILYIFMVKIKLC